MLRALRRTTMPTPNHRIDFTTEAQDIYDHALFKGYKFLKSRNLDSWLSYGWSMLFKRTMTDFDIKNLQGFLAKKKILDLAIKTNQKLSHADRNFDNQYIGSDGYVYMNKMMTARKQSSEQEAKIEKLLIEAKENRLRRYEEYEVRHLNEMALKSYLDNNKITYKGKKITWGS